MEQELQPNALDGILCVKVGKVIRENLYEMARKYWKVKLEKASKATHVLAIINGIVEAVYIPQEWKYSEESGYEDRIQNIWAKVSRAIMAEALTL